MLKKYVDQAKALLAQLETLAGKMDQGDDAAKAAAKTEYEAKSAEYATLESKIEQAKSMEKRRKALAEDEALGKTVVPGVIPAEKAPATAKNEDNEERELENHFGDWFFGAKSVPDRAMDALQPKSSGWSGAQGGLALPKRLAKLAVPNTHHLGVMGKALPMLTTSNYGNQLVQAEYKQALQQYQGEGSALLPLCFTIPTKSGSVIWPYLVQGAPGAEGGADEFAEYGFLSCNWTSEGAEKPDSEPRFGQRTYSTHELAAKTRLSRTLLNRSVINIEQLLSGLFRAAIMHKIDLALIAGDGNGKPLGILDTSAPATTIPTVARALGGSVEYEDLVKLQHGIPPQLRGNPGTAWVLADGALQSLKLQVDAVGRPIMPINPQTGTYDTLLGRPYTATQRRALGALGDVTFGDFGNYVVPIEQEVVISKSEHRYAETGEVLYVVFTQVGGRVAATRPFCALAV
jgi:HK97 family phage major capsid protein